MDSDTFNVIPWPGTELELTRKRSSWEQTWMEIAVAMSHRSRCVRAQYGAAIVDPNNRIVSTGYNSPAATFPAISEFCDGFCPRAQRGPKEPLSYDDCASIHAEANALLYVDRRDAEGGTIFVNGTPCMSCAKLIANSGLARVVLMDEPHRDYRDNRTTLAYLKSCKIEIVTWVG